MKPSVQKLLDLLAGNQDKLDIDFSWKSNLGRLLWFKNFDTPDHWMKECLDELIKYFDDVANIYEQGDSLFFRLLAFYFNIDSDIIVSIVSYFSTICFSSLLA